MGQQHLITALDFSGFYDGNEKRVKETIKYANGLASRIAAGLSEEATEEAIKDARKAIKSVCAEFEKILNGDHDNFNSLSEEDKPYVLAIFKAMMKYCRDNAEALGLGDRTLAGIPLSELTDEVLDNLIANNLGGISMN